MLIHASRSGRNQHLLYLGAALAIGVCSIVTLGLARLKRQCRDESLPTCFLLDVDNTLLANDRSAADLDMTVEHIGDLRALSLSDLHTSTAAPAV